MDVGVQRNRVVAADAAAPIVPEALMGVDAEAIDPALGRRRPDALVYGGALQLQAGLVRHPLEIDAARPLDRRRRGSQPPLRFDRRGEPLEDIIPTEKKILAGARMGDEPQRRGRTEAH